MPRPAFTAGQYYHLYNRGAHRSPIFHEPDNYLYVIQHMKEVSHALSLSVIAYCLLPNHYHFLVRQDAEAPAGQLAQRVFNAYSKAYNKRYEQTGTLFQGPYQAIRIDSQRYLLNACRYIHANPVRHGLVEALELWPYSNYLEWIGRRDGTLVDRAFIRDCFGPAEQYRAFVESYLADRLLPAELVEMLRKLEG